MWPMLLDYTRDDCKKILRRLELEAYASVVSAFRAQGEMSKDKKKMLQELSSILSISLERHRAEIRRVVNDEHLNTIAERLCGPNTSTEWSIEGRRVVPLMPRLVPQTAFTALANSAASAQAAKNAAMPVPSATGMKENCENENISNGNNNNNLKRKHSLSAEQEMMPPQKIIASDCASVSPDLFVENANGETTQIISSSVPMPVPQELSINPLMYDSSPSMIDGSNALKNSIATAVSKITKSMPSLSSSKPLIYVSSSSSSTTTQKPLSVPIVKTVSTSSTAVTSSHQVPVPEPANMFSNSNIPALSPNIDLAQTLPVTAISSSISSAISSTLLSNSSPLASNTMVTKARPKTIPASKPPPMKPRCNVGNVPGIQPPLINTQAAIQFQSSSTVQAAQKTAQILKSRSVTRTPSSCSTVTTQTTSTVQTFIKSQATVSALTKTPSPTANPHKTSTQIMQKHYSLNTSVPAPVKSATSPKSLSKSSPLKQPLGARTLLTSVTKPANKNIASIISNMPCSSRPSVQPPLKNSNLSQATGSAKPPSTQLTSPLPQSNVKSNTVSTSAVKTTEKRNEGLTIISQNVPGSRILPKPSGNSAGQNFQNRVTIASGTGVSGNTRVISFSQPFSTRLTRAISTSASAVNLASTTALRVTLPPGTLTSAAMMRAATPAKPNVIVVHKAQVWPQAQGTAYVMTSTGSISRLSSEAVQEAVSLMQRQDTSRSKSIAAVKVISTTQSIPTAINISNPSTASSSSTETVSTVAPQKDSLVLESSIGNKKTEKKLSIKSLSELPNISCEKSDKIPHKMLLLHKTRIPTTESIIAIESKTPTKELDVSTPEVKNESTKNTNVAFSLPTESLELDSSVTPEASQSFVKITDAKVESSVENKDDLQSDVDFITSVTSTLSKKEEGEIVDDHEAEEGEPEERDKAKLADQTVSSVNIPNINLDQLQEGQMLELQAQDAAELLSQHGQLSKEVLELLQQAGLQVQHVEVQDEVSDENEGNSEFILRSSQSTCESTSDEVKPINETEMECESGANAITKVETNDNIRTDDEAAVDIFSTALESAQLDLHTLGFIDDNTTDSNTDLRFGPKNAVQIISECESSEDTFHDEKASQLP